MTSRKTAMNHVPATLPDAPSVERAPLPAGFFDDDAARVATRLLGKVIHRRRGDLWLTARIIEAEAYYLAEKGSHASLGETPSRRALFMEPGTIYMYYARGGDSLNISCRGAGNAVLIKSGFPWPDPPDAAVLAAMQSLNPARDGGRRAPHKLCAGQTLLCRSLGLRVRDWTTRSFETGEFFIADHGDAPGEVIQAPRLGIPEGRDEHLALRFIDARYARHCTRNPVTRRGATGGRDYHRMPLQAAPMPVMNPGGGDST